MASPISCLSILVIPLLVTSLFYQVSNAANQGWFDEAFLEKICKKSTDYDLCSSTLRSDPRTYTVNPHGLALISISINTNLVQTTLDQIPGILNTLTDPLDETRLQNCQTDFNEALVKFNAAYAAASSTSYTEATNLLTEAALKSVECENEYSSSSSESPISDTTNKVGKLVFITYVIVGEITST
uniref:Pectinesterase inhibitor domain-containing protein n=1 Tax=Quercus lobata TaxID=97700 RepID=A0A7N2QYB6_QUELO